MGTVVKNKESNILSASVIKFASPIINIFAVNRGSWCEFIYWITINWAPPLCHMLFKSLRIIAKQNSNNLSSCGLWATKMSLKLGLQVLLQGFDTFLREDQVVLPRDQAIGRITYGLLNYVDHLQFWIHNSLILFILYISILI